MPFADHGKTTTFFLLGFDLFWALEKTSHRCPGTLGNFNGDVFLYALPFLHSRVGFAPSLPWWFLAACSQRPESLQNLPQTPTVRHLEVVSEAFCRLSDPYRSRQTVVSDADHVDAEEAQFYFSSGVCIN